MMFQRRGRNDAVIGFADGRALLSQPAVHVSGPDEDGFWHGQQDQWHKIAPHAPVGGVIGNALEDFCQYDAAQGKVLAIVDELLQRGDLRQITTREEIDPDAGVNQNH